MKNILKRSFLKSKNPIEEVEMYSSLESIPLHNWKLIYKEKDLKYLIVEKKKRILAEQPEIAQKLDSNWIKIYDEYLRDFGLNKKMIRILDIEKQIAILKCDLWIDDNKFLRNKIRILEKKLSKENQNTLDDQGNDFDRQFILIEKWLGSSIN